jgi:sec-independent protein translocase protein TatC
MESGEEREMSLVGHLGELRTRLLICIATIVAAMLITFPFGKWVVTVLAKPITTTRVEPGRPETLTIHVAPDGAMRVDTFNIINKLDKISHKRIIWVFDDAAGSSVPAGVLEIGEPPMQQVYYRNPLDPILLQFKMSIILSVLIALPILLWQLWLFIKPGLTTRERALVKPLLSWAVVLFPVGAGFAYFMLKFLLIIALRYSIQGLTALIDVHVFLSLMLLMMLTFGILFELPLVVALAARVGLVTPGFLKKYRRHAYVILAFAAMVLTPADPVSMLLMLAPLVLLFELSILFASPMARLRQRDVEAEIQEVEGRD